MSAGLFALATVAEADCEARRVDWCDRFPCVPHDVTGVVAPAGLSVSKIELEGHIAAGQAFSDSHPEQINDWMAEFTVDLAASRQAEKPVLWLRAVRAIG
jgi:hypothetical protein